MKEFEGYYVQIPSEAMDSVMDFNALYTGSEELVAFNKCVNNAPSGEISTHHFVGVRKSSGTKVLEDLVNYINKKHGLQIDYMRVCEIKN